MLSRFVTASIFVLIPLSVFSQSLRLSPDSLALQSDVVVVGKVGNRTSEWTADKSRIQTRVSIAVTETIKGSQVPAVLEVVVPGGEIDGVGEWYSHTSRFEKDEEVVLFAKKGTENRYNVAGGDGGKYTITRDATTGRKTIPLIGSLEAFTSKLRNTVLLQQTDKIRK